MIGPVTGADKQRVLLVSKDLAFASLVEVLLAGSGLELVGTVGPAIALESVRTHLPVMVLLDLDSVEAQDAIRLVLKISLVSYAPVLVTGVEAYPGSAALDSLFQAGIVGAALKPEGKTSLSLATETGRDYLEQLRRYLMPHTGGRGR